MPVSACESSFQRKSKSEGDQPRGPLLRNNLVLLALPLAVAIFCAGLIVFWFASDSRVPTTDEAGHILNALEGKRILTVSSLKIPG